GEGSKADKVDARKLADLLRTGMLRSVYHGHEATRNLKELVRAYETLSIDTLRTMVRIKAIFRGRGIPTPGRGVYQPKQRERWLEMFNRGPVAGLGILGFRQNDVLVTEASVPASTLLLAGGTYAEVNGPVNTGLAIVNP